MSVLVLTPFGSNLYGTSVPSSDVDYRGVYLPELSDCVMNRIANTRDDIIHTAARSVTPTYGDLPKLDVTYFSLQKLVSMALEGQSVAIEMLCAPTVATSPVWESLRSNRKRFFTKQMASFMGYAKSMSSRYSVRIDRLNETKDILKVLSNYIESSEMSRGRLATIWELLPVSLNAEKTTNNRASGEEKRCYRVCGREISATVRIDHAFFVIQEIHSTYGERVRKASSGDIDWKALMHAFRVTLQCKEIVQTGDLVFPLKDAPFLRSLRLGEYDFVKDGLDKRLDDLIAEVQALLDTSTLPDAPDRAFGESVIMGAYNF